MGARVEPFAERVEKRIRADTAVDDVFRRDLKRFGQRTAPRLVEFFDEKTCTVYDTIGKDPKGYFLKMNRFRLIPGSEPALLVAFPELSYVNLVTELVFRLEDTGVIRTPDNSDTFLAEGFAKNDHTGALEFYAGGECVAAIEAKWFVIDVTKEKMLLKMSARKKKKR